MSLSASLLCLLLGACGGGDEAAADVGGGGNPVRHAAVQPSPPAQAPLPAGHTAVGVPLETLHLLSQPFGTPHQAIPAGVPWGYDWRERSRVGAGNKVPLGFQAFTGWAQAFWIEGAPTGTQRLEVRQYQTLLCKQAGNARRWHRVQVGDIEGAAYRADYQGGVNVPAEFEPLGASYARIGFGAGRAYHFWARQGRTALGPNPLCGMLVLFEARAVAANGQPLPAAAPATLLIGGGADYWLDTAAPWDHYRTNIDAGIGVLRRVGPHWQWHGMGIADNEAVVQLARDGFVDRQTP